MRLTPMSLRPWVAVALCICTGAIGYSVAVLSVESPTPSPSKSASDEGRAPTLRIGTVDVRRILAAHPKTKASEDALNAKRAAARAELDQFVINGLEKEAKRFRESREKELQDEGIRLRKEIADDVRDRVTLLANKMGFDLLLDSSGDSLNGIPVAIHASLEDITDEVKKTLSQ